MLQLVLYGLLAIVIAGGLFLLASRFLPAGEQIAPPLRDEPPWELPPDRMLKPADVDSVRLPVALRGYRFAETDILLDRLAGELRARDDEIARLRGPGGAESARRDPLAPMAFAAPRTPAEPDGTQAASEPEIGAKTERQADPTPAEDPADDPSPWAPRETDDERR